MLKLARWSTTHRKYVVIGWIVLLIGVNAIAQSAGTSYSNNFTLPNSDAQRAADLLATSFPAQAGDRDTIVYQGRARAASRDPAVQGADERDVRRSREAAARRRGDQPLRRAPPRARRSPRRPDRLRDGRLQRKSEPAAEERRPNASSTSRAKRRRAGPRGRARRAGDRGDRAGRLRPLDRPSGCSRRSSCCCSRFGSVLAMGLPIVTALFGLGTGLGADRAVHARRRHAELLLRARGDDRARRRHRLRAVHPDALPRGLRRRPGRPSRTRASRSCRRSTPPGAPSCSPGSTVVIALLGMMLLGVSFLYGVAISASIGVLLVMLASLTLLPALLTLAGARVAARRARAPRAPRRAPGARAERRRPTAVAAGAAARGCAGAPSCSAARGDRASPRRSRCWRSRRPATALRLGSSDASNDPVARPRTRPTSCSPKGFGTGFNGPLLVVAKVPTQRRRQRRSRELHARDRRDARRRRGCRPAKLNPAGDVATITVYPQLLAAGIRDDAARRTAARERVIPPLARRRGADRLRRRRDRRRASTSPTTLGQQAAALHRRRRAALGAAADDRLPLAADPAAGGRHEPARIGASLGVIVAIFQWGWFAACSASSRARSSRSSR